MSTNMNWLLSWLRYLALEVIGSFPYRLFTASETSKRELDVVKACLQN